MCIVVVRYRSQGEDFLGFKQPLFFGFYSLEGGFKGLLGLEIQLRKNENRHQKKNII